MSTSLRFSIWDLVALTFAVALFASNFFPREIVLVDPAPGVRFWDLGFPMVWTKYVTPTDDTILEMAIQNWRLIMLNAIVCFAVGMVIGKLPKWIIRSTTPESNPAKVLLYFYGFSLVLLALQTPVVALAGTSEASGIWDPERPAPTLAASVGGFLAILLARREFDRLNRSLTIGWGMAATFAMLYLSFITFPSPVSSPLHARSFAMTLLFVASLASVAWLGWQKPAFEAGTSSGQLARGVQL